MKTETLEELIEIKFNNKVEKVTRRHAIELILDSDEFKKDLYEGLDDKKREELGQFYTPGKICIQMIEKFSWDNLEGKTIMDPTCGSGNLLIACLIAGADSDKLYGNEYDEVAVKLCRKRINRACDILGKPHIPYYHIHQGNALQARCLVDFSDWYIRNYKPEYINDLEYAQSYDHEDEITTTCVGTTTTTKVFIKATSWGKENTAAAAREKTRKVAEAIKAGKAEAEEQFKKDTAKAAELYTEYKKLTESKDTDYADAARYSAYCEKYKELLEAITAPVQQSLFNF